MDVPNIPKRPAIWPVSLSKRLHAPARLRPDSVPRGQFLEAVELYADNGRRYRQSLRRLD